jgi:hypothetical protein
MSTEFFRLVLRRGLPLALQNMPLTFNLLHGVTVFAMIFSEVRVEQNARAFTRSFCVEQLRRPALRTGIFCVKIR